MTLHGSGGETCGGIKRISMIPPIPPAPEKVDNMSETGSRVAMVKRSVILEDVQVLDCRSMKRISKNEHHSLHAEHSSKRATTELSTLAVAGSTFKASSMTLSFYISHFQCLLYDLLS